MPLKTEELEEPVLNLTPMIDIMMLLIFFFMAGAKFVDNERQFEVNLPTVSEALPLSSLPDELVITVTKEGDLLFRGNDVTVEELETRLHQAVAHYADQAVVVRGDAQGYYQYVMDVLAVCHRVGVKNLSLANRVDEE